MIHCPKCNSDNMVGAIFCRECGEKLNLDDIKPADVVAAAQKTKVAGRIFRNLIGLILLLVVLGGLGAIFLPPSYRSYADLSEQEMSQLMEKRKSLSRVSRKPVQESFTERELAAFALATCFLTEDDKAKSKVERMEANESPILVGDRIVVNFAPPNQLKIVMKHRLWDKVSVYSVLDGSVAVGGSGVQFTIDKVSAGRMPVFVEALQSKVIDERFRPLIADNQRYDGLKAKILDRIKELAITADQITVTTSN